MMTEAEFTPVVDAFNSIADLYDAAKFSLGVLEGCPEDRRSFSERLAITKLSAALAKARGEG